MQPQTTRAAQDRKRGATVQPLHVAQIADALLTLRTAAAVAGLSETTIYRKEKTDPTFPRLIRMGQRCTRIRAGDLTAWLAAQAGA
ncbi:MAG: hypothetical protein ABS84_15560 [Rubrivivax sp. SCN 71-131]|nr:MAG: hypothetical protein ABS84_15560 [Rubrivivax sp. SCN 71-131]